MRQSLGKIIFLWLAFTGLAWGGAYQWRVLESPEALRIGQSGIIRYECAFDGSAGDYTIEFKPKSSDAYNVRVLTQTDRITQGKRVQTFDVLITPLHEGMLELKLEALIRHTTFASIENAIIGRDNVKKYDFNDEKIVLPGVLVRVSENTAALTGNITLEAHADHAGVRAHEPLHLSLYVRGSGNLDQFIPYELNISGVKVFAEPPLMSINPSPQGYEGEIRQEFALIAEKSYVIAPMTLRVFDTTENRIKELKTAPIHVEVGEGYEPAILLDSPDLGDRSALKRYALYAGLIVLGIILGETVRRLWKLRPRRRKTHFWDHAKTSKELVQILALNGDKRHEEILRMVEEEKLGLSEAKKKLSTLTSEKEERCR